MIKEDPRQMAQGGDLSASCGSPYQTYQPTDPLIVSVPFLLLILSQNFSPGGVLSRSKVIKITCPRDTTNGLSFSTVD
jgi:hypothetical protein